MMFWLLELLVGVPATVVRGLAAAVILVCATVASAQPQTGESDSTAPQTGPLSGYMDFHFNKADGEDGIRDLTHDPYR
jgi:hypothetical protein